MNISILDTYCGLVVPRQKGGYIISVGKSVCHFDWDTKELRILATVDEGKETFINDGKCDSSGRLWFGIISQINYLSIIFILFLKKYRKLLVTK